MQKRYNYRKNKYNIFKRPFNRRPTFYNYGRKTQPIRASGILYYRQDSSGSLYFLMQRKYYADWNEKAPRGHPDYFWEDLGGKTDRKDNTIKDTASRECSEETNYIIKRHVNMSKLNYKKSIYLQRSKYLLFIAESPINYKTGLFGDYENHEKQKIPRIIEWVPERSIYSHKYIHPRLRYRKFYGILSKLLHKVKYIKVMSDIRSL